MKLGLSWDSCDGKPEGLLYRFASYFGRSEAIGFLIAAKSILRFGAVGDDRAVSK